MTLASPNFNERAAGVALRFIVLHYTGMKTAAEALARLTDPAAQVSAHYMIDEDGFVIPLVDEGMRAWHAGKSFWLGQTDINSASIGIELVNPGHAFGYRPFPNIQIASLIPLLQEIVQRHALDPQMCLLAHADIAPDRKEDPGELFPWPHLAESGLGLLPLPRIEDFLPLSIDKAQALLSFIGYQCPKSGQMDAATAQALRAFQRHYAPESLLGPHPDDPLDTATSAALRSIARIIKDEKA